MICEQLWDTDQVRCLEMAVGKYRGGLVCEEHARYLEEYCDEVVARFQPKGKWRVGTKIPLNVYQGERPICQCHTAKDAAAIVAAMNAKEMEALG